MAVTYDPNRVYTREEKQAALWRIGRSLIAVGILYAGFPLLWFFMLLRIAGESGQTGMANLAERLNNWASR